MTLHRFLAALAVTAFAGPALAQVGCPYPITPECSTLQRIDEERRRQEAEAEQRRRDELFSTPRPQGAEAPQLEATRSLAERDAALQAMRTKLLATAPLPPGRNPLLGRWRIADSSRPADGDELTQLMGMLTNPGNSMCAVVFGEGTTEFLPDSWASSDSMGNDSLGPIQYRAADNRIYVLPDAGMPLLGFEIIDKNRIREMRMPDCVLARVGTAPAPSASSAPPSAAPQPKPSVAAPAPQAKPANASCKVARVQLGVDTVATVELDIQARGGSPLAGGGGLAKYRVSALSGDFADAGPDVMAVNYDFDADGPAGRLVAVTIVNAANNGAGYEELLAARKAAAAAIAGPLQQKSPTELIASSSGCQLRLLPKAGTWFIYEVYQLPN
jgi:hypothetical protein